MTKSTVSLQHQHRYGIDPHNGFLPSEEPLSRLDGEHEMYWEHLLDRAIQMPLRFAGGFNTSLEECQSARSWRREVRQTPLLEFTKDELENVRYIRRARVVLSFLAHLYIHSQPNPIDSYKYKCNHREDELDTNLEKEEARGKYKTAIPSAIAVPWSTVSKLLELPSILTYADTVLWNWHLDDTSRGIQADNLLITTTFSNTETERHFFKTSLLIELQGAKALDIIQSSINLVSQNNPHSLSLELHALSRIITDMVKIFIDITSACVPSVFYWDVRTWFNGSDTSPETYDEHGEILQEAGKGWTHEGITDIDNVKILTGPSAGQSSVIHALDIFLGVDHTPHHHGKATKGSIQTISFMQKMQRFMPGPHSRYLTHLDDYLHSNIPTLIYPLSQQQHRFTATTIITSYKRPHLIQTLSSECRQDCLLSYNEAITKLCLLRDQHMRIVAIYILGPARQPPPYHHAPLGANIRVKEEGKEKGERGTGGTELVSFLKGTRNRTRQARLLTMEST